MNRLTLGVVAACLIAAAGNLALHYRPGEITYSVLGVEYTPVSELAKNSDVVVRGTVLKRLPAHRVAVDPAPSTPNPDGDPPQRDGRELIPIIPLGDPPKSMGLLETDSVVQVQTVLSGTGVTAGQLVNTAQLGGTNEQGVLEQNEDDPLMVVGDDTILFLRRSSKDPSRSYVVGITQGRFTIDAQGQLHSAAPESAVGRRYEGKPLDALLADLKSL
jgi:hypothetical protein